MPRKPKTKKVTTEEIIEEPTEIIEPDVIEPAEEDIFRVIQNFGDEGAKVKIDILRNGTPMFAMVIPAKDAQPEIIQQRLTQKRLLDPNGSEVMVSAYKDGALRYQKTIGMFPSEDIPNTMSAGALYGRDPALMEILAELRASRQPVQQQSSALELAQAVAAVRETAPPPVDPVGQLNGVLGLLTPLITLIKESIVPQSAPERPFWQEMLMHPAVAPVVVPALTGFLSGITQKPNGPNGQPMPPQNQVGPEAAPVIQEDPMRAQVKSILQYLKTQVNVDPAAFVDIILGNQHDASAQTLLRLICTESFDYFTSIDAEIGQPPFDEFFRAIYDGIRSAVPGQDPMVTNPGRASGNSGNLKAHAKPNGQSKPGRSV